MLVNHCCCDEACPAAADINDRRVGISVKNRLPLLFNTVLPAIRSPGSPIKLAELMTPPTMLTVMLERITLRVCSIAALPDASTALARSELAPSASGTFANSATPLILAVAVQFCVAQGLRIALSEGRTRYSRCASSVGRSRLTLVEANSNLLSTDDLSKP